MKESFAVATTDTGFRHLLGGGNSELVRSFLNTVIPNFKSSPIVTIESMPNSVPVLKEPSGQSPQLMDLRVRTETGANIIVEMQARRHVNFDEWALYYAANAFARQLSAVHLNADNWYEHLKPVVAIQILDYDTNHVRGISNTSIDDTLVQRVKLSPMKRRQYMKHFNFTDEVSKQKIMLLQLIQIELPRADQLLKLFPPRKNFTIDQWWLSVLCHASDYTKAFVQNCAYMPPVIREAFNQLDLGEWGSNEIVEYKRDLHERFASMIEVEKVESKSEGKVEAMVALVRLGLLQVNDAHKVLSAVEAEELAARLKK